MTGVEIANQALELIDSDAELVWPKSEPDEFEEFRQMLAYAIAIKLLEKK